MAAVRADHPINLPVVVATCCQLGLHGRRQTVPIPVIIYRRVIGIGIVVVGVPIVRVPPIRKAECSEVKTEEEAAVMVKKMIVIKAIVIKTTLTRKTLATVVKTFAVMKSHRTNSHCMMRCGKTLMSAAGESSPHSVIFPQTEP